MGRIRFLAQPDQMGARLTDVPAFPGDSFGIGIPESIGAIDTPKWFNVIKCTWQEADGGKWSGRGWVDDELDYTVSIDPHNDYVDVVLTLTNKSRRDWKDTYAFNCFQAGGSAAICDHECKRHWVRSGGEFRRLIELPRQYSPRPTVQLYSVEGARPGKDIPFVHAFRATPEAVAIEGWMAIRTRDGKRLVAVVSKPALFTFQNREYSCIHSGPSFGPLKVGESGKALTRVYFVEATLEQWYDRMVKEFAAITPMGQPR